MRCDEVIRELAAPTGEVDRSAMSDHLLGCAGCSEWARRAEGLDRLWEATRPASPSAEAWDAAWSGIAATLPGPAMAPSRNGTAPKVLVHPVAIPNRSGGRGWRLAAIAMVGVAQAAAILLALGLAWRGSDRPGRVDLSRYAPEPAAPQAVRSAGVVEIPADIEPGSLMVIRFGKDSGLVEDRTPPEMNLGADAGMDLANTMESLATRPVAAR